MANMNKTGVVRELPKKVVGIYDLSSKLKDLIVLTSDVMSSLNAFSSEFTRIQTEKTAIQNEKASLQGQLEALRISIEKEKKSADSVIKAKNDDIELKVKKAQADMLTAEAIKNQAAKEFESLKEQRKELNIKMAQVDQIRNGLNEKLAKLKELSA